MNKTLVKGQFDVSVNAKLLSQQANASLHTADSRLQQTSITKNQTILTTQQGSDVLTGDYYCLTAQRNIISTLVIFAWKIYISPHFLTTTHYGSYTMENKLEFDHLFKKITNHDL